MAGVQLPLLYLIQSKQQTSDIKHIISNNVNNRLVWFTCSSRFHNRKRRIIKLKNPLSKMSINKSFESPMAMFEASRTAIRYINRSFNDDKIRGAQLRCINSATMATQSLYIPAMRYKSVKKRSKATLKQILMWEERSTFKKNWQRQKQIKLVQCKSKTYPSNLIHICNIKLC